MYIHNIMRKQQLPLHIIMWSLINVNKVGKKTLELQDTWMQGNFRCEHFLMMLQGTL